MKLSTLNLANYRGYDQLSLEFDPELTVIAGVNGVGKSSLLAAIVHCASNVLLKVSCTKEKTIGLRATDIKAGKIKLSVSSIFQTSNINLHIDTTRRLDVSQEEAEKLTVEIKKLREEIRETEKGSSEEEELLDKIRIIENNLNSSSVEETLDRVVSATENDTSEVLKALKSSQAQPLVIHYSTSRHMKVIGPKLNKTKKIDISTAYLKSLDQLEVSLYEFANWYRVEQENKDRANTLFTQLNQAVSVFMDGVDNLELYPDPPPKFSVEKNGARFFLEQLSDGERGLLALVFDLTRRLCIANPESDSPLTEGKAIVLIDEVELHLHPKWQRMVVRKLREAFPACQFIITTHSPQVIGQVKPEKLRLLVHDDNGRVVVNPVSQTYGMDSSWVLENIMGVPARDYETEQRLSAIYDAIDDDKFTKARHLANALKREIGDFPDLQEAIALLDRFELLGQG